MEGGGLKDINFFEKQTALKIIAINNDSDISVRVFLKLLISLWRYEEDKEKPNDLFWGFFMDLYFSHN